MNCSHGGGCFILAIGDLCPVCRQIVTAVPQRQVTRGEVGGSVGHALEPAPREFAGSAPTLAATSPHGLDCGTPSANAHHGADPAPTPTMTTLSSARPSAGPGEVVAEGELAQRVHGGEAADMAPQHGAHAPASSPAPSLLDMIDATPRARITDPDTAHQAAGFQAGRLTRDMRVVLAAHVAAGERGLTGPELATATRRTYEQIGPRRKPLETAGLVEKTERRPKDPTQPAGSLVWAYRITDLGRDVYAQEQARSTAA